MADKKPTFGRNLSPFTRFWLILAGTIAFGLGMLGIPLPLLPTTPFLLLSAYCYARSSKRFYNWLITHPTFGEHILNYQKYRSTTRPIKSGSIFLLWFTISLSAIFAVNAWWVRLLLLIIAFGVTLHILSVKTIPKQ
ncbi:MAG: YbaN family protein [Bacteroidales bacterium]